MCPVGPAARRQIRQQRKLDMFDVLEDEAWRLDFKDKSGHLIPFQAKNSSTAQQDHQKKEPAGQRPRGKDRSEERRLRDPQRNEEEESNEEAEAEAIEALVQWTPEGPKGSPKSLGPLFTPDQIRSFRAIEDSSSLLGAQAARNKALEAVRPPGLDEEGEKWKADYMKRTIEELKWTMERQEKEKEAMMERMREMLLKEDSSRKENEVLRKLIQDLRSEKDKDKESYERRFQQEQELKERQEAKRREKERIERLRAEEEEERERIRRIEGLLDEEAMEMEFETPEEYRREVEEEEQKTPIRERRAEATRVFRSRMVLRSYDDSLESQRNLERVMGSLEEGKRGREERKREEVRRDERGKFHPGFKYRQTPHPSSGNGREFQRKRSSGCRGKNPRNYEPKVRSSAKGTRHSDVSPEKDQSKAKSDRDTVWNEVSCQQYMPNIGQFEGPT
eukprot:Skav221183  [mRNA]  locus=scaffold1504:150117:160427:- [translate_table: standard]